MPELTFEMVRAPTRLEIIADARGRLLRFDGARLARAEVNKNRDEITPAGVGELAATIGGMPIDDEHDELAICGIFTQGQAVEDPTLGTVLEVGGLIHAQRYPQVAAGIQDGTLSLSIEADGTSATCSVCGQKFASSEMYCDHLQNKVRSGAVRRVEGLVALGGGVVRFPAGNGTDFSNAAIRFVASHADRQPSAPAHAQEAYMKKCPYCKIELTAAADVCPGCQHAITAAAIGPDLAQALAQLQTLGTESQATAAAVASLTNDRTQLAADLDKARVELTAAQTQIAEGQAVQKATTRRAAVGTRLADAAWDAKKAVLLAMDEAAFAAVLELLPAPAAQTTQSTQTVAGIALGAGQEQGQDDGKIKIVL